MLVDSRCQRALKTVLSFTLWFCTLRFEFLVLMNLWTPGVNVLVCFGFWVFGIWICLGFRISCLGFPRSGFIRSWERWFRRGTLFLRQKGRGCRCGRRLQFLEKVEQEFLLLQKANDLKNQTDL